MIFHYNYSYGSGNEEEEEILGWSPDCVHVCILMVNILFGPLGFNIRDVFESNVTAI